jgi:hypothetical protein
MNERIQQLAEQAGKNGSPDHSLHWTNGISDTLEKFAELIVKECMSLMSEPGPDMNDTERGILAQIKQHFGVEE